MPSKVSLMNRALRIFAGQTIVAPDEGSASANACSQAFEDVLDIVLSDHPWSHAQRWARLALSADTPPFGFTHSYRLPADALRLVDIRICGDLTLPPARHVLSGQIVFTDASPAYARYVFRHADPTFWPQPFCEAFCMRLAAEVAPYLGQQASLGLSLRRAYYETLESARVSDALQSNMPEENSEYGCDFLQGRTW